MQFKFAFLEVHSFAFATAFAARHRPRRRCLISQLHRKALKTQDVNAICDIFIAFQMFRFLPFCDFDAIHRNNTSSHQCCRDHQKFGDQRFRWRCLNRVIYIRFYGSWRWRCKASLELFNGFSYLHVKSSHLRYLKILKNTINKLNCRKNVYL